MSLYLALESLISRTTSSFDFAHQNVCPVFLTKQLMLSNLVLPHIINGIQMCGLCMRKIFYQHDAVTTKYYGGDGVFRVWYCLSNSHAALHLGKKVQLWLNTSFHIVILPHTYYCSTQRTVQSCNLLAEQLVQVAIFWQVCHCAMLFSFSEDGLNSRL